MKKNAIIIILTTTIILIIIGVYILSNKDNNIDNVVNNSQQQSIQKYTQEEFSHEVELYNKILLEATSLDDLEKCEQLGIEDVYNTCISSINLRYGEIGMAKTLEDCEKVGATEKESQEFRQDVCKYNVIKKMDKYTTDYEKLCGKIVDEDIKNACIGNFEK